MTLFFIGIPVAILLILISWLIAAKKRLIDLHLSKVFLLLFPVCAIPLFRFVNFTNKHSLALLKNPHVWMSLAGLIVLLFMTPITESETKKENFLFQHLRRITNTSLKIEKKTFVIHSSWLFIALLITSVSNYMMNPAFIILLSKSIIWPLILTSITLRFINTPVLIALSILVIRRLNGLQKGLWLATPLFLTVLPTFAIFPVFAPVLGIASYIAFAFSALLIVWLMLTSSNQPHQDIT